MATSQLVKQIINVRSGNDRRFETAAAPSSGIVEDSLVFISQNRCVRKRRYFAFARFCTTTREAVLDPSFEVKVEVSLASRLVTGAKRLFERNRREVPVPDQPQAIRRQLQTLAEAWVG